MSRLLAIFCLVFAGAALGQARPSDDLHCSKLFDARRHDRFDAAESARITERWLVTWYPNRARFEEARATAIKEKVGCIDQARAQVAALEREIREFESKLDVRPGQPLPAKAQAYIDLQAAERVAAKEHELQQVFDLARIQETYDAQLKRLQGRPGWQ